MAGIVKKCPCLRPKIEEDVRTLDYRHCSLSDVPGDVFNFERTLEELFVDSNQLRDLPRELFYCHGLRKLSLSDNEITSIPPAVASLISLEELDISKNGIIDMPDNIKGCKYLSNIDASVNPLGKLPEGFTQLLNLTQLYLNDTFLDYLPGNFGRLSRLKILELRENHLKTLPKSFSRLTELERLDIGNNEFTELPDVVGSLTNLLEFWCDHNQITTVSPTVGNLKNLIFLDGSKNRLQSLPEEIDGCSSLADLHLTTNNLQTLPKTIGNLENLTTLKIDDNQLISLPTTLGGLSSLSELNISANDIEMLPASIGLLRYLRTLYADENYLEFIPAEIGSCTGITVLSLRSNNLSYIPDEIGRIPRLRVLNLSDNRLQYLPHSIVKLKELQALWLAENQTRPLIPFQSEYDPSTGFKVLTCYLLPQRPSDAGDIQGDNDSFHASMWDEERTRKQQIQFEFGEEFDPDGKLVRSPTPYPKEMREPVRHSKNVAMRQMASGHVDYRRSNSNEEKISYKGEQIHMEHANMVKGSVTSLHNDFDEARISQPSSPSLQDSHKLYRYDKEKLAKDKARMQQRKSREDPNGDFRSSQPLLKKDKSNGGSTESSPSGDKKLDRKGKDKIKNYQSEEDDGGFSRLRFSADSKNDSTSDKPRSPKLLSKSQSYHSIMEKAIDPVYFHHSSQKSHGRHRRGKEYDSDTGYKSDQDAYRHRRQQLFGARDGNYSDIEPNFSRRGHREYGYNSDVEVYSRGRGSHRGHKGGCSSDVEVYHSKSNRCETSSDVNDYTSKNKQNNSYFKKPLQTQFNPRTIPFKRTDFTNNYSELKNESNDVLRSDELYDNTGKARTLAGSQSDHTPSPSAFHRSRIVDQSTPIPSGSPRSSNRPTKSNNDDNWRNELFMASKQLQKAQGDSDNKSQLSVRRDNIPLSIDPHTPGPPPYNPAPAYTSSQVRESSTLDVDKSFKQLHVDVSASSKSAHQTVFHDRNNSGQVQNVSNLPDKTSSVIKKTDESRNNNSEFDSLHKYNLNDRSVYIDPYQPTGTRHKYSGPKYSDNYSVQKPSERSSNYSARNYTHLQGSYLNYQDYQHLDGNYNGHGNLDANSNKIRTAEQSKRYGSPFSRNYEQTSASGFTNRPALIQYEAAHSDPASQVSSSTDSGYGHSHHTYDKNQDRAPKYSGSYSIRNSQKSPNNSFSSSPTRELHSSSQSREATPSRSTESFIKDHAKSLEKSYAHLKKKDIFRVNITKNPGLGFSIAGGIGSHGNPFQPNDMGIFVTKIQPNGPASVSVRPGDKLLEVNGIDFAEIEHIQAVSILKNCSKVTLLIERILS